MPKNLTPEDFVDCRLTDKQFLDDEGFLLSSYDVNNGRLFKSFGDYTLGYEYSKRHRTIGLTVYDGRGTPLGIAEYCPAWKPSFRLLRGRQALTRSGFLEAMMPLDKDLAFWLLWNL
jgi:hypothetical protein